MGTSDVGDSVICVVTLDHLGWLKDDGVVTSKFERYSSGRADCISWTAKDVDPDQGWVTLAHGSLFFHCRSVPIDPFRPVSTEVRDDVEKVGSDFVYENGYALRSDDTSGVYHIVFPENLSPTKIEYLSRGSVHMIFARVLNSRAVITWMFDERLQLKITMRPSSKSPIRADRKVNRDELYRIATISLGERRGDSDVVREMKTNAVQKSFEWVPTAVRFLFGG